jgi:ribosomal protein S18 acetylase RimI-like enzyme
MMQIRRATVNDARLLSQLYEPVQRIHHAALPDLFKPAAPDRDELIAWYATLLLDRRTHTWIGEVDGEPAGYIIAQESERPENPFTYAWRMLNIDQIALHEHFRGRGYGKMLIQQVFAFARQQGIQRVTLTVWAFNAPAQDFFEKQGFRTAYMRKEISLD